MGGVLLSPVVGIAHEGVWSQVLVLKHFRLGILAVMVCVRGSQEQVVREQGQEFLRFIEEKWQETEVLDAGAFELEHELRQAATIVDDDLEIMAWRLAGERVEMVGFGAVQALVQRRNTLGVVLAGVEGEWRVVEGSVETADRWLVGTHGLMSAVTKGLIVEVLTAESVGEAAETLTTQVQATQVSAAVAGVVIFGTGEAEETAQVAGRAKTTAAPEGPSTPIFLKEKNKKRKTAMSVGIILLLLLGVSVFLGARQRENARLEALVEETLVKVRASETLARGMAAQDPGAAGIKIREAVGEIEAVETTVHKRADLAQQLTSEKGRLEEVYREVTGEANLDNIDQWLGLDVVREGLVGVEMELIGEYLYVLDSQRGLIVEVDTGSKEANLVAGGEFVTGGLSLSGVEGRLALWHPRGVIEINPETNTTGVLVQADEEWERLLEVRLFSGNVYAVDTKNQTIWRYPGLSSGVGEEQPWLGAGVEISVGQVVDMAIDGDIWLVLQDATILRLRRGAIERWERGRVATPLITATAIDTKADDEGVYVFDQKEGRVVRFDKETGMYQEQFRWGGFRGVSDIAVDEAGGFVYALSGGSIYRLPL